MYSFSKYFRDSKFIPDILAHFSESRRQKAEIRFQELNSVIGYIYMHNL